MLGYSLALVDLFEGLNAVVRVTIKGWDEESSERITGAKFLSTEDCLFLDCSNLPPEDDCFRLGAHYCVPVFVEVRTVADPSIVVESDAVLF